MRTSFSPGYGACAHLTVLPTSSADHAKLMSNTLSLAIFINLLRLELTTIGPFYRDRRTHCPVLAGSEMASLKRRV